MTTLCEPMLLKAAGKHSLWGGDKLIKEYGKDYLEAPLAETWECSTHENGLSYVDSGIWKGWTLKSVFKEHPEFFGSKYSGSGELPILVKFIDAAKDLSVQVHPNDEYAAKYENGSLGKTEMWYIAEAEPGSCLFYGFYDKVNKEVVRKKIQTGNIDEILQKIPVKTGDVFYIPPGTVHALGHGILAVEIQESSNLTYRLFDYNRIDKYGRKRELHIEKALKVCNFSKCYYIDKIGKIRKYINGSERRMLCLCPYFVVEKITINGMNYSVDIKISNSSFLIFVCLSGCGTLKFYSGDMRISKGRTYFVPAGNGVISVCGIVKILKISC